MTFWKPSNSTYKCDLTRFLVKSHFNQKSLQSLTFHVLNDIMKAPCVFDQHQDHQDQHFLL